MKNADVVLDSYNRCATGTLVTRRSFLGELVGIGTAAAAIVAIPVLRFVSYPLYLKAAEKGWSIVGGVHELADLTHPLLKTVEIKQVDGWRETVSLQSVYVARGSDGEIKILSATCPHLGCSIAWRGAQAGFVCPCHGGRFAPDGTRISGPPPRGMDTLSHKIQDGSLLVKLQSFRPNIANKETLS
jgi:Rieske Fe-S protein